IKNISIAAGYQYSHEEVAAIPNFQGELALYKEGQAFRAFVDLHAPDPKAPPTILTPDELIERSSKWADSHSAKVDLMVLGEGIDAIRVFEKNARFRKRIGRAYVMGGGRLDGSGKLKMSRNWLAHSGEVLRGFDKIGEQGGEVFVFSSNEFGGSL